MAHLVNKDFSELAADGSNYLTWTMDVKIMLTVKGFNNTIEQSNPRAPVSHEAEYTILYFLRHRLHPDLKNEYMMKRILEHFGLHTKNAMINKRQSFCPKQGESGLYFVLWISNLLQNITLPFLRFVPSFIFEINRLMMQKKY
jgi:hypothetical protein